MATGYIKIIGSSVDIKLTNGTVWMTVNEIADLFGVNSYTINNCLKGIFKDKLLIENKVTKEYRYACLSNVECIRTYYNLDVIIFLSFKIQTIYTKAFREWVFRLFHKSNHINKIYGRLIDFESIIKENSFSLN